MPPITYTIDGGTAVFCALNRYYYMNSSYNNPDANTLIYTETTTDEFAQSINFISNGNSYDSIHLICSTTDTTSRKMYYVSSGVETLVYDNRTWTNDVYRTIIFETQDIREKVYDLLTGSVDAQFCGYSIQSGTYKWNPSVEPPKNPINMIMSGFISNKTEYGNVAVSNSGLDTDLFSALYVSIPVDGTYSYTRACDDSIWIDDSYKVISIPENSYISYNGRDNFFTYYSAFTPVDVDMTTLSGYSQLVPGTQYNITVKAIATGYQDSDPSEPVSYTIPASTYTLEAGTYKWVDILTVPSSSIFVSLSFSDLITEYTEMSVEPEEDGDGMSLVYGLTDGVYDTGGEGWISDNYRTITLSTDQTVSAEFYEWAITGGNLVKQESETWVLNEIPVVPSDKMEIDVGFNSNGNDFNQFYAFSRDGIIYIMDGAQTQAWNANWIDESYRTITFTQPVTDTTLLTWLQANGTKQGGVTEHTLTFNDLDSLTVNGLAVTSPYTLQNGDVIVATKKAVWGDTPNDSYEATVGASYDGNDITVHSGSDTISVSNANIAITAWTTLHPGSGEMDNAVLTINYTA